MCSGRSCYMGPSQDEVSRASHTQSMAYKSQRHNDTTEEVAIDDLGIRDIHLAPHRVGTKLTRYHMGLGGVIRKVYYTFLPLLRGPYQAVHGLRARSRRRRHTQLLHLSAFGAARGRRAHIFECASRDGRHAMMRGRSRWLIDIPDKGVATESGAGAFLLLKRPLDRRLDTRRSHIFGTKFRHYPSPELIYSLGARCVRLHDADKLSAARRRQLAATAYDAAHAGRPRCGRARSAAAGSAALLLLVASVDFRKARSGAARVKGSGAPPAAVAAFASSVERMERSRGPAALPRVPVASRQQLALSHMLLGHAHLALSPPTRAQASAAVRAFVKATAADPTSLAAAASAGRSLVLFARQHLTAPADDALSNRTVEAAVRARSRQPRLLESLRVPTGARRSDVYSGRRPLWWADGLLSLGQAFQLLAASNEARSREAQIASLLLERRSAEQERESSGRGRRRNRRRRRRRRTSDCEKAARALPPRGMGPPAPAAPCSRVRLARLTSAESTWGSGKARGSAGMWSRLPR